MKNNRDNSWVMMTLSAFALGLTSCGNDDIQVSPELEKQLPLEEARGTAVKIMDAWAGEQFEEVVKHLAPPETEARSAKTLKEKWEAKTDAYGAFVKRGEPKASRDKHGFAVVEFDLEFEKAAFDVKMIFTRDGALDDYFMSLAE